MGRKEDVLRDRIISEYGSVRKFSQAVGIPDSTLRNIFTRGIDGVAAGTVVEICKALKLDVEALMDGDFSVKPNEQKNSVWAAYCNSGIIPMPDMRTIPLLGSIACGQPILAQENMDGDVLIPSHVSADFALRCKGDSMINARIFDGDIVYIRQQDTVDDGQIAAVLIEEEATLKRVHFFSDRIVLEAANPLFQPIVLWGEDMSQVRIIGKAVAFTSTIL